MPRVFLLARIVTYATVFVGLFFVGIPAQILSASRIEWPATIGVVQVVGALLTAAGAALAAWCVLTFAVMGRGTPAPFDPPRDLVMRGPYRYVRNPMDLGGAAAMLGVAVFYRAPGLLAYAVVFMVFAHLFVVGYEEPTLRRKFPHRYSEYFERVRRWVPKRWRR